MEAVAAFSLAGTVLQFLDAGGKFIGLAGRLHRSGSEGLADRSELLLIATKLEQCLSSLPGPTSPSQHARADPAASGPSDDAEGFAQLAANCRRVAVDLVNLLRKIGCSIGPPNSDPRDTAGQPKVRMRDAVKTAFRLLANEDEITCLQERLNGFRSQMNLHLLLSLRRFAAESAERQNEILSNLGGGPVAPDLGVASSVVESIAVRADTITNCSEVAKDLARDLVSAIYRSSETLLAASRPGDAHLTDARRAELQRHVLARLQYVGWANRQGHIATAYDKTFQWVFDKAPPEHMDGPHGANDWTRIPSWLKSDDQVYWITGKAGSGKSTLMKFICGGTPEQARCLPFLREWAGSSQLITASFYFWSSGTELQMKQEGLLITLLRQVLSARPDLIPQAAPRLWEVMALFGHVPDDRNGWEVSQLLEMLRNTSRALADEGSKMCLFIDGLDEFDGDPKLLIDLVVGLVRENKHLKLCVASRPWVDFLDAFQNKPSLRVEDLTYRDIHCFVTGKFQESPDFSRLQRSEPAFAEGLIRNIVDKASGVFLWVNLVVSSLLSGLSFGDRISDLQRRLDLLPPELENLYENILQSLDPFYIQHAAQYFSLVRESGAMSMLLLSFADEETPDSAVQMDVAPLPGDKLVTRMENLERRINSRCKGLLEIGSRPAFVGSETHERLKKLYGPAAAAIDETLVNCARVIEYLHRTVKDYLDSPAAREHLRSSISTDFDAPLQLCAANLSMLKATPGAKHERIDRYHFRSCLILAPKVRQKNEGAMVRILDELSTLKPTLDPSTPGWSWDSSMSTVASYTALADLQSLGPELSGRLTQTGPRTPQGQPQSTRFTAQKHRCSGPFGYFRNDQRGNGLVGGCFLSLVARYGVVGYLKARVAKGALVQVPCCKGKALIWPLLMDMWDPELHHIPHLGTTRCLLERGADPNFSISAANPAGLFPGDAYWSDTPWEQLLCTLRRQCQDEVVESKMGYLEQWTPVISLFLEHGADRSRIERKLGNHHRKLHAWFEKHALKRKQPGWLLGFWGL